MIEWLCNQEGWNSEDARMFGKAARYLRATVYSSHDDVQPDSSTLHSRGRIIPNLALWRASSSYHPVLAMIPKCTKFCQLFVYFVGVRFSTGVDGSIFLIGPAEAGRCTYMAVWAGWLF
jgi:hypothetical protein